MGLDSVELLMSFEEYFGIQFSHTEAGRIRTVNDMANAVARHKNIHLDEQRLKATVFRQLNYALLELNISKPPKENAFAFRIIKESMLPQLEEFTGLKMPRPYKTIFPGPTSMMRRIFAPRYDRDAITIDRYVTGICALNFEQLIDREDLSDRFEIYAVVSGITAKSCGLDILEIEGWKRFTDDLGID